MTTLTKTFFLFIFILGLISCGSEKSQTTNSYKVKTMPVHKSLHFTGTVQPLNENTLTSPMDAVVESMNFHYGQMVKKNDIILVLNSSELQKSYNDLLTEYLKAKDSYTVAKAKFTGTQDLWNAGLLAKNNYLSEKSSVDTSRVTLMESTRKLTELLSKMDDNSLKDVSSLSLSDFEKLKAVLTARHNLIHIKATQDGILLYPPKSDDKTAQITVGSAIKSGQVLALIGDLKGITITIDVPEIDIDKIHPGMEANISGIAFGKHQLKGQLVAVNAQASNTNNGGLPSFTAMVEVTSLTEEEQHKIKVGMSAAIELNVDTQNQLLIPIAAVKHEQGNNVVHLKLAQGNIEKRIITTGPLQSDTVVIESGLKSGDVVLYD
ncbi:MAG: efflux RND transporter periplasmic adaptor subunit [Legionella sp.]|nr:efflux RND transporter periplasmic adaptor subunit [Legionella sp.]